MTLRFGGIILSLFLLFLSANAARAQDRIDVEHPVGFNVDGKKIFSETNIYPGWETSETVRVENDSGTDTVDLYFKFDAHGGKKLAEALKIRVIRLENGSYRIGGEGDRWTLETADGKRLYVDRLSPAKGKQYRVKIAFDEDAGNEYQNLKTKFDLKFRIESEVARGQAPEEILADEGRIVSGNPPRQESAEVAGESNVSPGIVPAAAASECAVSGASAMCMALPGWIWVLELAILIAAWALNDYVNTSKGRYRWKLDAALLAGAMAFWYFFDQCREYRWFLSAAVAGAIFIHFVYLAEIKSKNANVKS